MDELPVAIFFVTTLAYLLSVPAGQRNLNPVALFLLSQMLMFVGTLPLLDPIFEADRVHLWVMTITQVLFITGALVARAIDRRDSGAGVASTPKQWWAQPLVCEYGREFDIVLLVVAVVSVAATVTYYVMVGYNVFVMSVESYLKTGSALEDAGDLRKNMYNGDAYFAPGYFNQFKNVLLPIVTVLYLVRYALLRRRRDFWFGLVLVPICIVGLLGTGQRGAMALAFVFAGVFGWATLPQRTRRLVILPLALGGLFLFAVSTLFLGRSATRVDSAEDVFAILNEMFDRVFWGNQFASLWGFRYIYHASNPGFGSDWLAEICSLLPRPIRPAIESSLNVDIFEVMFHDREGTAPPSLWGSVWYNFGRFGVVAVPLMLGALYQRVQVSLFRRPKSLGRILTYTAICVYLGLWGAGGPLVLANNGLLTALLLGFLLRQASADRVGVSDPAVMPAAKRVVRSVPKSEKQGTAGGKPSVADSG